MHIPDMQFRLPVQGFWPLGLVLGQHTCPAPPHERQTFGVSVVLQKMGCVCCKLHGFPAAAGQHGRPSVPQVTQLELQLPSGQRDCVLGQLHTGSQVFASPGLLAGQ